MRRFNRILWPGLLALFLSSVVNAQGHGTYAGYPAPVVSGSATVWGNSMGDSGYSGTININNGYGYAAVPVLITANPYAPVYYPAPAYVYPQPYYRGHSRGHRHGHKHGSGHDRGHH